MSFFNQPYKGPYPNEAYISPGLVPLVRPTLYAPMPLASNLNSNKVIANESTQSVAEPITSLVESDQKKRDEQIQPVPESVTGPVSLLKVSNYHN